jgi:hypothetical protein
MELGSLQWHYLLTIFHENLQNGSEIISGDTQSDWRFDKPTFIFGK